MDMTRGLRIRPALIGACLAGLTAGFAQATSTPIAAGAGASREQEVPAESAAQRFDPLTITVALRSDRVVSGKTLRSRLIVENRSESSVVDADCDIGTGRYALIPVDDPDAELWVRPMTDCGGPNVMEPGYRAESSGPEFPAHTKYGEPLPPGEYLAVVEIRGRSGRLKYPVTVE